MKYTVMVSGEHLKTFSSLESCLCYLQDRWNSIPRDSRINSIDNIALYYAGKGVLRAKYEYYLQYEGYITSDLGLIVSKENENETNQTK